MMLSGDDLRAGLAALRAEVGRQPRFLIFSPHEPPWVVAWWQRMGVKTLLPNGNLWPEQPDEVYAEALRMFRAAGKT